MKSLILQQKEEGMRLAALAALQEQEGNHKTALHLWQSSATYPCEPINTEWREKRAMFCEKHADFPKAGVSA